MAKWLIKRWYSDKPIVWLLPFSWYYQLAMTIRTYLYKNGIIKSHKLPVPVIVVGNISVGGTGKTPTVIWLVKQLQQRGFKPGVISRGYGRRSVDVIKQVTDNCEPKDVGDEPILIYRQTKCPVVVARNRVAAARYLLSQSACDILISDDGLQHYALQRDIEIVVLDGERRYGNKACIPAGPLREPCERIETVDYLVVKGAAKSPEYAMSLEGNILRQVGRSYKELGLNRLVNKPMHAVAGIGNPQQFFQSLRQQGVNIIEHHYPDHHQFRAEDIDWGAGSMVIMTEKDAVKCEKFADARHWYLPVEAQISSDLVDSIVNKIKAN